MAESSSVRCLVSTNLLNTKKKVSPRPHLLPISSLSRKHEASSSAAINGGGSSRTVKRLITLSPSEGKWNGNWNTHYNVSLRDLQLQDLVEDGPTNPRVSVHLSVQRHASMGLSVDGRIVTSFSRKCSICSSAYPRLIDTNFTVWILPSSRENRASQMPEIGGDDPSVIYVRPGYEANLDSLVQDTIRLTTYAKDICSDSCEKSEPTLHYVGETNTASVHKRWSRLLELKTKK
ncbi:hypothetical protein EUTSA_v10021444mg [Eutrema salsugineum]|uniref:Large ribosomal RNA subunit accumulation protein YCED homolog 2, chloroplastic n=1 Tax=Eutrema salsugineum TaxID=72664 RepID=V4LBT8_EUTSA|nr:large ribosomal RNA subunit accumulation protein YCED homolog 2, chloroplastic isoform X1 [Eutrema salsugineum]ESQ47910.1 hypothetical protein EUTSA_v10021444mg [Eutrema salsugineum]